jgi:hypothetical protein
LSFLGLARAAHAAPQWNVGVVAGVCGAGEDRELWDHTCFYGGLRGDVLFARERNSDLGFGPYLEVATAGFDDLRVGLGPALLLPIHPYFPLGLSAGGYARNSEHGFEPGVAARLFFGSRSYNFHSTYGMAGGLLAGVDYGLGESKEILFVLGVQLDGLVLALPFLAGYQLLRGPPPDAE